MPKDVARYTSGREAANYTGYSAPTPWSAAARMEREARKAGTAIEVNANLEMERANAEALLRRIGIAHRAAEGQARIAAASAIASEGLNATSRVQNLAAARAAESSELALPGIARMSAMLDLEMTDITRDEMRRATGNR